MSDIASTARHIMAQVTQHWPARGIDIARCFEDFDECARIASDDNGTEDGTVGVIERTDGAVLTLRLNVYAPDGTHINPWPTWYITTHVPTAHGEEPMAANSGTGKWPSVTRDIAATVTAWLQDNRHPAAWIVQCDTDQLVTKLDEKFLFVIASIDDDGMDHVFVDLRRDADGVSTADATTATAARIYINYAHDDLSYAVQYENNNRVINRTLYDSFDELVAALQAHGAQPQTR